MSEAISQCTARGAHAVVVKDEGGQFVDVREFPESETERVAGATLAPLTALLENLGAVDPEPPVYLLCRSGKRAQQAAGQLAARGVKDLRVNDSGLKGWGGGWF